MYTLINFILRTIKIVLRRFLIFIKIGYSLNIIINLNRLRNNLIVFSKILVLFNLFAIITGNYITFLLGFTWKIIKFEVLI